MLMAISCFYTQIRVITTTSPIEMWAYGICRHAEPWICYVFYQLEQLSALASGLTIYGTFFLKYRIVTGVQMTKLEVLKTYLIFYCPLFISILFVYIIIKTQTFAWETEEQLRLVNAFLNPSTEYIVFGYLSFKAVPNVLNLMIFTGCVIFVPIISLYSRKKTMLKINSHMENMSPNRQILYRNFVTGLTVQCISPYICYVPIYTIYYYVLFTNSEIFFLQFFLTFIPALPCLIDPFISLYSVTTFRKKLILWAKRERDETRMSNAFTT